MRPTYPLAETPESPPRSRSEAPGRPVAPWEVLDLGLSTILSCESWREVTAAVRRYPRRTQFIIRHWSPVGGKFHQADGLWMVWVSLGGVLHARAIRRHWPIDPR